MSGADNKPPFSEIAKTEKALDSPFAVNLVPSRGSTAISNSSFLAIYVASSSEILVIFILLSLVSGVFLSLKKNIEVKSLLLMDYLSILVLNYFLNPIIAFTVYFCFLHSIRHSMSLINEINKNLKKGLPIFIKKALPLTILTIIG